MIRVVGEPRFVSLSLGVSPVGFADEELGLAALDVGVVP